MDRFIRRHLDFQDSRGKLIGIFNDFDIEESNIVESSCQVTRGHHYHKDSIEILHVLDGELTLFCRGIDKDDSEASSYHLKKGDTVVIYPYEYHWSYNDSPSRWINFLTKRFSPDQPDIHK